VRAVVCAWRIAQVSNIDALQRLLHKCAKILGRTSHDASALMANDHGLLDNEAATLHVLQVVHIAPTYANSSYANAHFIGL
jgi:hypothetical protein